MKPLPTITEGVYLVLDPSQERAPLLDAARKALRGGVSAIQIWDHWPDGCGLEEKQRLADPLVEMGGDASVPVLANEDRDLLKSTAVHGIHFDRIPEDYDRLKEEVGRDFLAGITCGNDLEVIRWAEAHDLDYISFCAVFPSDSAGSCEIVRPETVREAKTITDKPLFLSGGITPDNLGSLKDLDFNGVAVISGIQFTDDPEHAALKYRNSLKKIEPGL